MVDARPVTGLMTVWVVRGMLRAARSSPRAAADCWTAESSSARACAPEPARGGSCSARSSARAWSSVMTSEYASCASRAVLLPVSAALRAVPMPSRSFRRTAGASASARTSSTCRSTRALRCSEGALDFEQARGDVRGDLVALVGQRVGERQRLLGPPGERHQVLGVVQLLGGREDRGGSGADDGGRDDRHGDDQPIAHVSGAALARRGLPRGTRRALRAPFGGRLPGSGGRLLACAPRPHLLHRCSHS